LGGSIDFLLLSVLFAGGNGGDGGENGTVLSAFSSFDITTNSTGGNGGDGTAGTDVNLPSLSFSGGGGGGGAGGYGVIFQKLVTNVTVESQAIFAGNGGAGGDSTFGFAGSGGDGGVGILFAAPGATLTHSFGAIVGGSGGKGGHGEGGNGGNGGDGVLFADGGATLTNSGSSITGGSGGVGIGGGHGGAGGNGVLFGAGGRATLTNTGAIVGGSGGAGFSGGAGGDGVLFFGTGGATFSNNGTVIGGNGGDGVQNGNGGVGVSGANLTIIDSGKIAGGLSGSFGLVATQADAIDFTGGTNILELLAGYALKGNVVAFSAADSLELAGSSNGTFDLSQVGSQFIGFGTLYIASPAWVLTTTGDFATQLQIVLDQNRTGAPGTVDTNGSNGTLAGLISGDGQLIKTGAGALTLSHSNTYSGGTLLNGGTLDLAALGAAGGGAIKFGNTGSDILKIEDNALSGHAFGNAIDSFGIHDVIDLPNLMFFKGATASYDSGTQTLTVTSGSITDTLALTNPGLTSLTGFAATSDGASGRSPIRPVE
jgi:hypothetical protein